MVKFTLPLLAIAVGLVSAGGAVSAAEVTKILPGIEVFDTSGGTVGKIDSVTDGYAVVDTGNNKVRLPLTSFGSGTQGPLLSVTRAELDAAAAKAESEAGAALRAKLVAGVLVRGAQGQTVGTIKAVDGQFALIATAHGDVRLPLTAIGNGPSGLFISLSADELKQAMNE